MGSKLTVSIWTKIDPEHFNYWDFEEVYRGESFFKAVCVLIKYRFKGHGCIKLEWRP